jgi:hypothetical protein
MGIDTRKVVIMGHTARVEVSRLHWAFWHAIKGNIPSPPRCLSIRCWITARAPRTRLTITKAPGLSAGSSPHRLGTTFPDPLTPGKLHCKGSINPTCT